MKLKRLALATIAAISFIPIIGQTSTTKPTAQQDNSIVSHAEQFKSFVKSLLYFTAAYGTHKLAEKTPWAVRWLAELNAFVLALGAGAHAIRTWISSEQLFGPAYKKTDSLFEPCENSAMLSLTKSLMLFGAAHGMHTAAGTADDFAHILGEFIAFSLGTGSLYHVDQALRSLGGISFIQLLEILVQKPAERHQVQIIR